MRIRSVKWFVLAALIVATPSAGSASTLGGNLTADDTFSFYVSVLDNVAGTLVCSDPDNYWGTPTSCGPALLTPGVTNYLHVMASDLYGTPSMFIGTFTLSDGSFQFGNGSQTLSTNGTNWVVRTTGFGDPNLTPVEIGPNGTGPWGSFPTMASNAQFIWDVRGGCNQCTRYFSTAITPTDVAAVPEPATLTLLGLGLTMSVRRFRSRRKVA